MRDPNDDDDDDVVMYRNGWHLNGGTKQRLLVTDLHGVERVVEVMDDLEV